MQTDFLFLAQDRSLLCYEQNKIGSKGRQLSLVLYPKTQQAHSGSRAARMQNAIFIPERT
jgi:hypothetical protein